MAPPPTARPPPPLTRTIGLLLCQCKQYGVERAVTVWLRKEFGSIIPHSIHISLRSFSINKAPIHSLYSVYCNMKKKLWVILDRWRLEQEISAVLDINYMCVRRLNVVYTDTWKRTFITVWVKNVKRECKNVKCKYVKCKKHKYVNIFVQFLFFRIQFL